MEYFLATNAVSNVNILIFLSDSPCHWCPQRMAATATHAMRHWTDTSAPRRLRLSRGVITVSIHWICGWDFWIDCVAPWVLDSNLLVCVLFNWVFWCGRLTEQVNQWVERTATVEERLKAITNLAAKISCNSPAAVPLQLHVIVTQPPFTGLPLAARCSQHTSVFSLFLVCLIVSLVKILICSWIITHLVQQSCMLRISEAKKAAGVVIGIESTLAWPEGFQTGLSHFHRSVCDSWSLFVTRFLHETRNDQNNHNRGFNCLSALQFSFSDFLCSVWELG